MRLQLLLPTVFLLSAVAFASCKKGGEEPATETPAPTAETPESEAPEAEPEEEATEPGAPNIAWADKDAAQRKEFMGVYVFPKMKDSFKAHDAERFGTFKCQTCHGEDGKANGYKMPNDEIIPLPADNPIEMARDFDAEVTTFMVDVVVPEMGELLGQTVDATTGKGEFGCHACHPIG